MRGGHNKRGRTARWPYESSCRAAGARGCPWSTRAATDEELADKVTDHARQVHGVRSLSDTIAVYAIEVARRNTPPT
jgi:predicted small metal-binding protein